MGEFKNIVASVANKVKTALFQEVTGFLFLDRVPPPSLAWGETLNRKGFTQIEPG